MKVLELIYKILLLGYSLVLRLTRFVRSKVRRIHNNNTTVDHTVNNENEEV